MASCRGCLDRCLRQFLLAVGEVVIERAVGRAGGLEEVAHARPRVPLAAQQAPGGSDELGSVAIGARHPTMIVERAL